MDEIPLKITCGNMTVRRRLLRQDMSWNALLTVLETDFQLTAQTQIRVRFLDEDDQEMDVLSNKDLEEALHLYDQQQKPIRLLVMQSGTAAASGLATTARHPMAQGLLRDVCAAHQQVAERVVDWWLHTMPEAYFREIDNETRMIHLRALIALQMAGQKQEVSLYNKDRSNCTVIKPGNYVGLLSEVIHALPKGRPLREANIYTAMDGDLVLDVFEFDDQHRERTKFDPDEHQQRLSDIFSSSDSRQQSAQTSLDELRMYLRCCDQPYVLNTPVAELRRHFQLVLQSLSKDNVVVHMDVLGDEAMDEPGGIFAMDQLSGLESPPSRLVVVLKREHDHDAFPRIVQHLSRSGVDILKATLNRIENFKGSHFVVLTCYVRYTSGKPISPGSMLASELCDELRRLVFVDPAVIRWLDLHPGMSLLDAERIVVIGRVVHCLLADDRPLVYTPSHIDQFMQQYHQLMMSILHLWDIKLAPLSRSSLSSRFPVVAELTSKLNNQIEKAVELEDRKIFFQTAVDLVNAILKTNMHLSDRMSLTLRLEPSILKDKPAFQETKIELPYGLFFVMGRGFVGLHMRFRDIARGGMRLVVPASTEEFAVANRGLIQDAYQMALAQQHKNKDIPEGGAKALIVVEPGMTSVENAAKSFSDGLLDLTCSHQANNMLIADYFGEPELIFLGPDDHVSNNIIAWICNRAIYRQHPFPNAFMSSKPGAGINHEEFAVASEGIAVFLDVALRHLGIDPRQQPFTVKLTGGPDGTMASNMIRILFRNYAQMVKIVAIADSSGVAEDPYGLNHQELLRLVQAALPIVDFARSKLSPKGHVISVGDGDGIGVKARNSMHFRVESDVFIPAGGRQHTINATNWMQFMTDNRPCSRLILEGSHQFLSPEARQQLSRRGAVIINEVSANKCGVICSSYEVLASMLLSDAEFLSIKGAYVNEVLFRLRHLARLEALILFKEFHQQFSSSIAGERKTLPEISTLISKAIIQVKDAILMSGQLDVYALPLPKQSVQNQRESNAFFIESPLDQQEAESESNGVETDHQAYQQHAKSRGFNYNTVFHKLCRDLLLEYIPPSLRTFAISAPSPPFNHGSSRATSAHDITVAVGRMSARSDDDHGEEQDTMMSLRKRPSRSALTTPPTSGTRLDSILPLVYRKRILATALACRIIYNEGVQFLDATLGVDVHTESGQQPLRPPLGTTPPAFANMTGNALHDYASKITEWSFRYLMEYERTANLIETVQHADHLDPHIRKRLVQVLERGGTRIGVEIDYQLGRSV